MTATSGADAANPMTPPADRMAGSPADSSGVPDATWIRPRAPTSSAVQPITIRAVSALLSGCRRKRQASRPSKIGIVHDPDPNSVTSARRQRPDQPARVPPGRDRRDDRGAEGSQAEAVPAMQRVQVTGAAAESTADGSDRVRERHPDRGDRADRSSPPGSRTGWSAALAEWSADPSTSAGWACVTGSRGS